MKEIKNLSKIKLILGIFIIAIAMLIFMPNVVNAAEVQTISNLEEYKNVMNSSSNTDEVSAKLTSDIDITSLEGSVGGDAINVYNNITLDLNKHKIITSTNSIKFWLRNDSNITIKNGTIEKITANGQNMISINHISTEYNLNMVIDNINFSSSTSDTRAVYMWEPENPNMMKKQNITFNNVIFDQIYITVRPTFNTYKFSDIKLEKGSSDAYAHLLNVSYLTSTDVLADGQGIYYYNIANELTLATDDQELSTITTEGKPVYVREARSNPIQVNTADDLLYALKFYPEADIKIVGAIDLSADYTLDEVFDIMSTDKVIDLNGNTITVCPRFFKFNYAIEGAGLTITDSSSAKSGKIVGNPDGFNYIFELSSDMTTKSNGTFKINGGTYVGSKYNGIVDMTNLNVTATFENSIYQSSNLIDFDNNCNVTYKVGNITLGGTNGNHIILAQNGNYHYEDIFLPDNKAYDYNGTIEKLINSDESPTGYIVNKPGYIKIKPDEGFNVSTTIDTLEYGYTSHAGNPISIYNRGLNSLTISNVTVDSGNFIIDKTGLQNATVASKATNSEVKIKVQDNLNPGTYTANITVTDSDGKTHTATVSVKVNPKTINANIIMNNWKYGQTASNPSITGLDDLATGQYEVLYNVKGESTTSTVKPTTPGTYEVSVNSKDTKYKINGKSEFTIEKATLNLAVVDKTSMYNGQQQTADYFKIILNGTEIGAEFTPGSNLSYTLVGEDKIKKVEFVGSLLRASSGRPIKIDDKTLNIDNKDFYKIDYSSGMLLIGYNTNAITIKPKNVSKEYHSTLGIVRPSDYEVTGSLAGSDTFANVTYTGERQYVGTTETSISSYKIMNGDVDVTACYSNRTEAKGQITINPFNPPETTPSPITMIVGGTIGKDQLEAAIGVTGLTATKTGVGSYSLANGFTSNDEGTATLVYNVPAKDINGDGENDVNSYTITLTITVSNKTNVNLTATATTTKFTYDGNAHALEVTESFDTGTITKDDLVYNYIGREGTTYNSATAPTNAGKYKLQINVKPDHPTYMGSTSIDFEIEKAQIAKPTASKTSYEFTGNVIDLSVSNVSLSKMNVAGITSYTNVGNYSVTYTLKDNYIWSDNTETPITIDWSITKKVISLPTLTNTTFYYDGKEKNLTIDTNDYFVEVTGTKKATNVGEYTINFELKDTANTKWADDKTGTISLKWKIEKGIITKTSPSISYTYDETEKIAATSNNLVEMQGTTKATNVGTYTYKMVIKDKTNYKWSDGTNTDNEITWKIIAADHSKYTNNKDKGYNGIVGDKLSSITLPEGFSWDNPDEVITAGEKAYNASYNNTNTNYKSYNDITLKVVGKEKFTITTSVEGGNGTITTFSDRKFAGEEIEIEFAPNTGYMIDTVTKDSVDVTSDISNNKLSHTVTANTTIKVTYKKIPFTITVEDVTGATVTPNGAVSVNYGDNKEFTIKANKGYELVKVLVDSEDVTSSLVADKLTLTNITKNMNVKVVVKEIKYEVTKGNNQKYTINKDSEAEFSIDADYTLFKNDGKVYVDNTLVSNENYTSKSGSTVITLKKDFVDTLSVGEHTLKVEFANGGVAESKFTVAKVTENNSENNTESNNDKTETKIDNDNKQTEAKVDNDNKQTETKVDDNATSTEVKENTKKEEKNTNNPKTSDMGIVPYIVTVIIATIGLVFVIKRKKTN